MLRAHVARGMSTLAGSGAHLHSVPMDLTLRCPFLFERVGVCPSGLDGESPSRVGDNDVDEHVLLVPVQVSLPGRAAAASKGTSEREWTVRTERSDAT